MSWLTQAKFMPKGDKKVEEEDDDDEDEGQPMVGDLLVVVSGHRETLP